MNPTRLLIGGSAVALAILAETGGPSDFTALGRDLAVAGVLFYFYRQLAVDFKKIVQESTAAITALKDALDKRTVECPFVSKLEKEHKEP